MTESRRMGITRTQPSRLLGEATVKLSFTRPECSLARISSIGMEDHLGRKNQQKRSRNSLASCTRRTMKQGQRGEHANDLRHKKIGRSAIDIVTTTIATSYQTTYHAEA